MDQDWSGLKGSTILLSMTVAPFLSLYDFNSSALTTLTSGRSRSEPWSRCHITTVLLFSAITQLGASGMK